MRRVGAIVVAAGCVWEVVAITTGKIPTITKISWKLRESHPVGTVVLWGVLGVLAWHLFIDENPQK